MRRGALLFLALLGVSGPVQATTADATNPYHVPIVGRNVFALRSPPPADPPALKAPPARVTLLGIVNAFGTRKAVVKQAAAKPAAPGQPPTPEEPLVLCESESSQGITVLAIDERLGTVRIDNNGQVDTLTFEKDGLKAPSGPVTASAGVAPPGGKTPRVAGAGRTRPEFDPAAVPLPPGTPTPE